MTEPRRRQKFVVEITVETLLPARKGGGGLGPTVGPWTKKEIREVVGITLGHAPELKCRVRKVDLDR